MTSVDEAVLVGLEETCVPKMSAANAPVPFPYKVHDMLDRSLEDDFEHIVSWLPAGNGFRVHDSKAFVQCVLPRFFRQTKYKSFQRQCNIWGFQRLLTGPHKGGYTHTDLVRGQRTLCARMRRVKIKGGAVGACASTAIASGPAITATTSAIPKDGLVETTTTTRSISPSFSIDVESRDYSLSSYDSPRLISSESMASVVQNTPANTAIAADLTVHQVPVSPTPDSVVTDATATAAALVVRSVPTPQTGDCIDFEGQNFFFISDDEVSVDRNDIGKPERNMQHRRRLSLDLFAASRQETDTALVEMLISDAIPTVEFSLTSSSYFY